MDTAPSNLPEPAGQNPSPLAIQGEGEAWDERLCGRDKADGTRCKAFKVKGKDACAGHLGLGIGKDPAAYAKQANAASVEARRDRAEERKKRPQDIYSAALNAHAAEMADRLIKIATDPTSSDADALRAIEALNSRVLGKPKETVETTVGKPELVTDLEKLSTEELWALIEAERRDL